MSKKGFGKFFAGAALGAGLGLLFAPKKGEEVRKELKAKMDEFVDYLKDIDTKEVKKEFNKKIDEIKKELADLDKEKALQLAKDKSADLMARAEDLVDMAKEKGTPLLKKAAEEVLDSVIKVSKDTLKKLEK
ncbi:MAG: YtxH domain-containing protein [Bacilli bacterium]|nr:YtxH domain-containing protein [Bacilli bacterium]